MKRLENCLIVKLFMKDSIFIRYVALSILLVSVISCLEFDVFPMSSDFVKYGLYCRLNAYCICDISTIVLYLQYPSMLTSLTLTMSKDREENHLLFWLKLHFSSFSYISLIRKLIEY